MVGIQGVKVLSTTQVKRGLGTWVTPLMSWEPAASGGGGAALVGWERGGWGGVKRRAARAWYSSSSAVVSAVKGWETRRMLPLVRAASSRAMYLPQMPQPWEEPTGMARVIIGGVLW